MEYDGKFIDRLIQVVERNLCLPRCECENRGVEQGHGDEGEIRKWSGLASIRRRPGFLELEPLRSQSHFGNARVK